MAHCEDGAGGILHFRIWEFDIVEVFDPRFLSEEILARRRNALRSHVISIGFAIFNFRPFRGDLMSRLF